MSGSISELLVVLGDANARLTAKARQAGVVALGIASPADVKSYWSEIAAAKLIIFAVPNADTANHWKQLFDAVKVPVIYWSIAGDDAGPGPWLAFPPNGNFLPILQQLKLTSYALSGRQEVVKRSERASLERLFKPGRKIDLHSLALPAVQSWHELEASTPLARGVHFSILTCERAELPSISPRSMDRLSKYLQATFPTGSGDEKSDGSPLQTIVLHETPRPPHLLVWTSYAHTPVRKVEPAPIARPVSPVYPKSANVHVVPSKTTGKAPTQIIQKVVKAPPKHDPFALPEEPLYTKSQYVVEPPIEFVEPPIELEYPPEPALEPEFPPEPIDESFAEFTPEPEAVEPVESLVETYFAEPELPVEPVFIEPTIEVVPIPIEPEPEVATVEISTESYQEVVEQVSPAEPFLPDEPSIPEIPSAALETSELEEISVEDTVPIIEVENAAPLPVIEESRTQSTTATQATFETTPIDPEAPLFVLPPNDSRTLYTEPPWEPEEFEDEFWDEEFALGPIDAPVAATTPTVSEPEASEQNETETPNSFPKHIALLPPEPVPAATESIEQVQSKAPSLPANFDAGDLLDELDGYSDHANRTNEPPPEIAAYRRRSPIVAIVLPIFIIAGLGLLASLIFRATGFARGTVSPQVAPAPVPPDSIPDSIKAVVTPQLVPPEVLLLGKKIRLIVVDKSHDRMWMIAEGKRVFQATVRSGGEWGAKVVEGDRRTPEGIYYVTETRRNLGQKFGGAALILDYPNSLDRMFKRNGGGIWLHGIGKPTLDEIAGTHGCVAMANQDLDSLLQLATPYQTLVYIRAKAPVSVPIWASQVKSFVDTWRTAWQARDIEKYTTCYSKQYRGDNGNFASFRAHKQRVFESLTRIELSIGDPTIIVQDTIVTVQFEQTYRAFRDDQLVREDNGYKRLYLCREAENFRILSEEFVRASGNPEVASR